MTLCAKHDFFMNGKTESFLIGRLIRVGNALAGRRFRLKAEATGVVWTVGSSGVLVVDCEPRTMNCELRTANYSLLTAFNQLQRGDLALHGNVGVFVGHHGVDQRFCEARSEQRKHAQVIVRER